VVILGTPEDDQCTSDSLYNDCCSPYGVMRRRSFGARTAPRKA